MKKIFLPVILIFCFKNLTNAQAGKLDSSFGDRGIVKTNAGQNYSFGGRSAKQILPLQSGSMYLVEGFGTLTKRRNNGFFDSSFGLNGSAGNANFNSISKAAVQPDGKILIAGGTTEDNAFANGFSTDYALARYNTDGTLDNSFSGDGKLTTNFSPGTYASYDAANAVAVQKDGKIVLAGNSNNYLSLARYNSNGSLDSTFGQNGLIKSNLRYLSYLPAAAQIALQKDGKIVVAGTFSIVRYNADGTVDKTFNGNGIHAFQAYNSIAIQKDGKIAAIGLKISGSEDEGNISIDYSICRFNTNGSFDKTFSSDGKQPAGNETNSLALQNDGKIVSAGSNGYFLITRYNPDGSFDKSFDKDGMQTTGFGNGGSAVETVAIQPDGKIVAGGNANFNDNVAIARYNTNGSPDNSFGKDGKVLDIFLAGNTVYKKIAVQHDGKVVTAGTTWNGSDFEMVLVRYNTGGSLDSSFSNDGILNTGVTTYGVYALNVAVQSDGKILAADEDAQVLIRFNANGSLDNTFHYDNKEHSSIRSMAVQSDGKIVVEGYTYNGADGTFEIRRYNTDGSLDSTFGRNGIETVAFNDNTEYALQGYTSSIIIQPDGKIAVGGVASRDYPNGNSFVALARLKTDGSLDNTFSTDGKTGFFLVGATSGLLAIQPDGKIVIGSDFANISSYSAGVSLKRFNTDGSIDNSFNGNTPLHRNFQSPTSIAVQPDGKIVLSASDLLRFNTDGSVDSTFDINAIQKVDFYIKDITIANNKLYAAGGALYGYVARYLLNNTNTPPTVSITSPANNTVYPAPANITVNATASDSDGTIKSVKFYNGTTYLKTDFTSPYSYTLSNLPAGTYSLTAKATDNNGAETISAAVIVKVNKAPAVRITSPANNAVFTAPANITVNALAADADGSVFSIKFYLDSTYLKTDFTSPYSYTLSNLPAGTYTIMAKATDNNGAQTFSAPVTVTVSNAAIVSSKPYSETEKTASKDALSLKLSPNPASSVVNIHTSGLQQNKPSTLSIISVSGIVLKTMRISNSSTQLDVSSLVSGVYTIKIISGEKVVKQQFVKL